LKIFLGDFCKKRDDSAGSVRLFACSYDIYHKKGSSKAYKELPAAHSIGCFAEKF